MLGAINTVVFCAFLAFGPSLPAVRYSRIDRIQVGPTPQRQCGMELAEELRIGLVNGPEEYAFTQIDALLVGAEGSIYVVDLHSQGIRQFDRNGQFVRWIGREGEGPGEFRSILGIGALSDGRFSIWDYGNRRITVYDSAGAYIEGIRVGAGAYTSRPFQVDTSGTYFLKVMEGQPGITSSANYSSSTTPTSRYLLLGGFLIHFPCRRTTLQAASSSELWEGTFAPSLNMRSMPSAHWAISL